MDFLKGFQGTQGDLWITIAAEITLIMFLFLDYILNASKTMNILRTQLWKYFYRTIEWREGQKSNAKPEAKTKYLGIKNK